MFARVNRATRIPEGHHEERQRAGDLGTKRGGEDKDSDVEMIMEKVPVGDHQAKGVMPWKIAYLGW